MIRDAILGAILFASLPLLSHPQGYDADFLSKCIGRAIDADINHDGVLDSNEFFIFVRASGSEGEAFLVDVNIFEHLPDYFSRAYNDFEPILMDNDAQMVVLCTITEQLIHRLHNETKFQASRSDLSRQPTLPTTEPSTAADMPSVTATGVQVQPPTSSPTIKAPHLSDSGSNGLPLPSPATLGAPVDVNTPSSFFVEMPTGTRRRCDKSCAMTILWVILLLLVLSTFFILIRSKREAFLLRCRCTFGDSFAAISTFCCVRCFTIIQGYSAHVVVNRSKKHVTLLVDDSAYEFGDQQTGTEPWMDNDMTERNAITRLFFRGTSVVDRPSHPILCHLGFGEQHTFLLRKECDPYMTVQTRVGGVEHSSGEDQPFQQDDHHYSFDQPGYAAHVQNWVPRTDLTVIDSQILHQFDSFHPDKPMPQSRSSRGAGHTTTISGGYRQSHNDDSNPTDSSSSREEDGLDTNSSITDDMVDKEAEIAMIRRREVRAKRSRDHLLLAELEAERALLEDKLFEMISRF